MESSEEQLFARFEREMSTDLSQWRRMLIDFYQDTLLKVYRTASQTMGRQLDITDGEDARRIGTILRDVMRDNWHRIDSAPMQGDFVSVAGKSIFQIYNDATKTFETELLFENGVLQGEIEGIDVQPYIDEVCLMNDSEDIIDLNLEKFIRPFGLHLVLQNATIVGHEDNDFKGSRLYIPLQYSETKLSAYTIE